jgi:hypothetical protein
VYPEHIKEIMPSHLSAMTKQIIQRGVALYAKKRMVVQVESHCSTMVNFRLPHAGAPNVGAIRAAYRVRTTGGLPVSPGVGEQ